MFAHECRRHSAAIGELYATRTAEILDLWDEGERTLIHGDPHRGNLFSDGGRTGSTTGEFTLPLACATSRTT